MGAIFENPGESPAGAGRAYVYLSAPGVFRINSGGFQYVGTGGHLFVADQAYPAGGFGHVGGKQRTFNNPIGGTQDDPLYQDLRFVREGSFSYLFDVSSVRGQDRPRGEAGGVTSVTDVTPSP